MTATTARPRSAPPRRREALAVAHACPVPGCPTPVSPGHVACRTHWLAVPRRVRLLLAKRFRAREHDPAAYAAASRLALQAVVAANGDRR